MNRRKWITLMAAFTLILMTSAPLLNEATATPELTEASGHLNIGWASADITPEEPVVITGFASARLSEGIMDPLTAAVLILESVRDGRQADMIVLVSIDLISVSKDLLDKVRENVRHSIPDINPGKIVLNATHTHAAPEHRTSPDLHELFLKNGADVPLDWSRWGFDLGVMSPGKYVEFVAERITSAIRQAWKERKPGGISFGLSHAVIGHNRLTTYYDGRSQMGGNMNHPEFSHVEGYEDPSLGLLYTWNEAGKLTGVVVNAAVTSQVTGGLRVSADFWHDARLELRRRLGGELFVLPQCAAAGDQSPGTRVDRRAESRMEELAGRNRRQQIAVRIADGVVSILPYMEKNIEWDPVLRHRSEKVELSLRRLTEKDITTPARTHHRAEIETVEEAYNRLLSEYLKSYRELKDNPELRQQPNWYSHITGLSWRLAAEMRVLNRYELQKTQPTMPVEVHVIRIGDVVMATNPFELYLDYGMQMKARSRAVQTFVVQLAGDVNRGYVPTERSVAGGAYGAVPQSTEIGPEGGRELVGQTLAIIESLWD